MLDEQRTSGSTGGIAPHYDSPMRISNVITLSLLLAPLLACGEDAPTRPEDGTVQVWGSCVWDDQVTSDLCEDDLVCSGNGVCSPTCSDFVDCPKFEGFENACVPMAEQKICKPLCNNAKECPNTDGATLICLQGYCVGD